MFDVRVLQLNCQRFLHGANCAEEHFFDLVLVGFSGPLADIEEHLVLATLSERLQLAFEILGVVCHFLVPSTILNDEGLRLVLVALHV